jgi:RimJ/RimL family protein N-acetyltransferase
VATGTRATKEKNMFARTERLLLRHAWVDDAPELAAAIAHESVAMKLARLPWPYSVDHALDFLKPERRETDADFLIFARTGGEPRLVGGIGLHDQGGELEIGYWLSPPYWGLGFATEAGRAVIDIARHTLRASRLVSGHFVDNPASGRVLRKLGFRPTGRVELRQCVARGHDVPCQLYTMDLSEQGDSDGDPDVDADMTLRTLMAA